jgi:signal transduction histidine kinase
MQSLATTGHSARAVLRAIFDALSWQRAALAVLVAVVAAALLNPIFSVPFEVLVGRMIFIAAFLLLAFGVAGAWPPGRVPAWLAQVLAVVIAAPIATLLAYLPSVGGDLTKMLAHEGRLMGFIYITLTVLMIAPLLALGALYRQRDAQARSAQLAFALERSTLEKEALDARLRVLQAQVEPHFLFNTLANVQALVESGSPQAGPVLTSLISYLRATVPKLHTRASTLAAEVSLARAYLELMQMRMPDRLQFSIEVAAGLESVEFLPLSILTLVENAVRHGIDPSERGGRIDISVQREAGNGAIRVAVTDSGIGMDDSAVFGIGLANLESRLRGFFGSTARLELQEVDPHGLSAEIVFTPSESIGNAAVGATS